MKYRELSNTGIDVSVICLGTMTFGEQNTEAEAHEQMDYAIDHGVNFFDTAELYAVPSTKDNNGKTEKYLGTWMAKPGNRDKVILATKVTGPSPNLTYISNNLGFSKSRVHEAIEKSLKNLQTDYVDLYQLHWPERKTNYFGRRGFSSDPNEEWEDNFLEVAQVMNDLIKEGKIRHWGVSNETPFGVMRFLAECDKAGLQRPVSVQNPYSLVNRTYEVGNAEISIRENVGLLAYSPMAFGLLSGKYHKGLDKPQDRINQFAQMSRYNGETTYEAVEEYLKLAEAHNLSLAQMALAFVNSREFLTSNIIGATSMQQLEENVASIQINLDNDVLTAINEIHSKLPNPAP